MSMQPTYATGQAVHSAYTVDSHFVCTLQGCHYICFLRVNLPQEGLACLSVTLPMLSKRPVTAIRRGRLLVCAAIKRSSEKHVVCHKTLVAKQDQARYTLLRGQTTPYSSCTLSGIRARLVLLLAF